MAGDAAAFLDRDGTIIEDRGSLRTASEVFFFPDTVPSLRLLQTRFRLFIVTNQPGIAEGIITPAEADAVHAFIVNRLAGEGITIERVYCCPHRRTDGCSCIKPEPFFLLEAARDYRIDLENSFVIGDHPHDLRFATNARATGIYVLTGHGEKHQGELPTGAPVTAGIREAAAAIFAALDGRGAPSPLVQMDWRKDAS